MKESSLSSGSNYLLILALKGVDLDNMCSNHLGSKGEWDVQDRRGFTPSMRAIQRGNDDLAEALIKAGSDINLSENRGRSTALSLACRENSRILPFMIHWASRHQHFEVFDLLRKRHPNVDLLNKAGSFGNTFLHWACIKGRLGNVKRLLQAGVDTNLLDNDGYTPVMRAIRRKQVKIALALIDASADLSVQASDGSTALMWAARTNNTTLGCKILDLPHGDINTRSEKGETCLWWACKKSNNKLALKLLQKGAETDLYPDNTNSPLVWAVKFSSTRVALMLLLKGAQPNVTECVDTPVIKGEKTVKGPIEGGKHVLQIVILKKQMQIISALFEHGLDVNETKIFSQKGEKVDMSCFCTPLQFACRHRREDVALLLLRLGAEPDLCGTDTEVLSPLMASILSSQYRLARELLSHGADPLKPAKFGDTLSIFHKTCIFGRVRFVKLIMDSTAAVDLAMYPVYRKEFVIAGILVNKALNKKQLDIYYTHQDPLRIFNLHQVFFIIVGKWGFILRHVGISATGRELSADKIGEIHHPVCLASLLLFGLCDDAVVGQIMQKGIYESKFNRLTKLVLQLFPTFLHRNPHVYDQIQNKVDLLKMIKSEESHDVDYEGRGQNGFDNSLVSGVLHEVLQATSTIPPLLDICVEQIRARLFHCSGGFSIYPSIAKLPPDTVNTCVRHKLYHEDALSDEHILELCGTTPEQFHRSSNVDSINNISVGSVTFSGRIGQQDSRNKASVSAWRSVDCEWLPFKPDEIEAAVSRNRHLGRKSALIPSMSYTLDKLSMTCVLQKSARPSNNESISGRPSPAKQLHMIDSLQKTNPGDLLRIISTFLTEIIRGIKVDLRQSFCLLPCGSVFQGNKVGLMDEFDFVLRWNLKGLMISPLTDENATNYFQHYLAQIPDKNLPRNLTKLGIQDLVFKALKEELESHKSSFAHHRVTIDACYVYNTGPAICIKLSWVCHAGHNHPVSIDISPMIIVDDMSLDDYLTSHNMDSYFSSQPNWLSQNQNFYDFIEKMKNGPLCLINSNSKVEMLEENGNRLISTSWTCSLNLLEYKMYRILDTFSPNIRKIYRLLKILRNLALPKVLRFTHVKGANKGSFKESQVISSYVLQCMVLREFIKSSYNKQPGERKYLWSGRNLSKRLVSCLELILKEDVVANHWMGSKLTVIETHSLRGEVRKSLVKMVHRDVSLVLKALDLAHLGESDPTAESDSLQLNCVLVLNQTQNVFKAYHRDFLYNDTKSVREDVGLDETSDIYFYEFIGNCDSELLRIPIMQTLFNLLSAREREMIEQEGIQAEAI